MPTESAVIPEDDSRNLKEDRCSRTHRARTQGRDEREGSPVVPTARFTDTHHLGVRGRIARLDPLIVPSGDDSPPSIEQNAADRNTTLAPGLFSLANRLVEGTQEVRLAHRFLSL